MIGKFLDFIDRRAVIRRVIVLGVLYMTLDSYIWAKGLVSALLAKGMTAGVGVEVAALVAAVLVPCTALQGYHLKVYSTGRKSVSDS